MPSPYEAALGGLLDELHPRLRAYFGAIQEGSVGVGSGVFDVVGTPRLWLWPALGILGRQGVAFAAWRRRVPFTVLHHPVVDARGNLAVLARRIFRFRLGERATVDAMTAERRGLVDYLGTRRRFVVSLEAFAIAGELHLLSRRFSVRLGRFELPVPRRWAPVVRLVERYDDLTEHQQVAVAVVSPRLGLLYECSGTFDYAVRPLRGEGPDTGSQERE